MPLGAKRALCLAYGREVPTQVMAAFAEHVDVEPGALEKSGSFDVVMLIGHPRATRPDGAEVAADFVDSIARGWAKLEPAGTLIVAFDPGAGRTGAASTLQAWLHSSNWAIAAAIDAKVRSLGQQKVTRLHVFPSVWRPLLMHAPESPTVLKRMAFAHVGGWRGGPISRALLTGGRSSPLDLCPAGIVWIASR